MDNQNFNNQNLGGMPQGTMPQGGMPMPGMMSPEQYMQWYQQQMQMMQQMQQQMQMQQMQQQVQPQMQQQVPPIGQVPNPQSMNTNPNVFGTQMAQSPMSDQTMQQPPVQADFTGGQSMNQPPLTVNATPIQPEPVASVTDQPMMVNGQLNENLMQRDPNVLNFMGLAVREKFKDQQITDEFVNTEAARLYDDFGEKLVSHFEPMLSKEQVTQFDGMLQSGATQDQLLEFLMGCIPDLTSKIEQVLLSYKDKYLLTM